MARYKVLKDINCGKFKPGDIAEFSEKEAASLSNGEIEPIVDEPVEPSIAPSKPKGKKK